MKITNKNLFKPKSVILLLGAFRPDFYNSTSDQRPATSHCVLEGRPSFESSRNSCRELLRRGITPTVIADNTAGFLFARGWVKEAWVAYQSADEEGLVCDSGALVLAVLARHHGVKFFAWPAKRSSKFLAASTDICSLNGVRVAPAGVNGYVPLMEFLPKKYLTKICHS